MDLKAHIKHLINKVFHLMLKLHCFKFLLLQRTALNFRFLCWKTKKRSIFLKISVGLKLQRLQIWSLGWISCYIICFFVLVIVLIDNVVLVSPWALIMQSIWLISISFLMSLISWSVRITHVSLCFIDCTLFVGLLLIFQTLRILCT
jgi:hypothetical protein